MKFIYSIFFFLFINVTVSAQTYSISGKVTDISNNPLPQINITIVGTVYGDVSDSNGNYKISNLLPGIYSVAFSSIGYETFRKDSLKIEDHSIVLNVVLKEEIIETEEILVTAGKYQQKKSELPVSAEIISGTEFSRKNFYNIEEALRYVPGIKMTEDQISIRGSSGYSRGTGSRVLLAIDGLPFYTGDTGETIWEMIPVTVLQRVEIIKGAASSLYGSSAIGGVINAITHQISSKPITVFNGYYGVYDKPYYEIWDWSKERRPFNGLTLSHSNQFGRFGFNVSFSRLEDLAYKRNNSSKKYIGFIKAKYDFTSTSSLTLLANTFNKSVGNFLYWKDSRNALIPPDANLGEQVKSNRHLFGLIYKNVLSEYMFLNLKGSFYYNDWKDNATPSNSSVSKIFRGEAQLNTSLSDRIILITGAEAITSKVNSNLFGNPNSFVIGVYAVTDFNFSFPLSLSLGIRYDYSKLDSLNGSGALSPKLGMNYKFAENLIFRSSLGTGFRAPSLAEAFTSTSANGITVKPNPELKSESNLTIEAGINYTPFEFFNLDFAAFFNDYYNMIEPGIDPADGLVVFDNVLRARIQGMEFNSTIKIFPEYLSLSFSYTYLWARDLDQNKALKYRPRHLFYSNLNFTLADFDFGIDYRYWSRVEEIDEELIALGLVQDGELRVAAHSIDLRAGYNLTLINVPVSLYLNAKNILNYNYVELIGNLRPIRSYSFGLNLVF